MPQETLDTNKLASAQAAASNAVPTRQDPGRGHVAPLSDAAQARAQVGLTQAAFAQLLGVSVRTLQNWEQGRSQPSGAAKTLIKVAQQWPDVLRSMA